MKLNINCLKYFGQILDILSNRKFWRSLAGVFQRELGRARQVLIEKHFSLMNLLNHQEVLTTWTPYGFWWWPALQLAMATCHPRQSSGKLPSCFSSAVSSTWQISFVVIHYLRTPSRSFKSDSVSLGVFGIPTVSC